MSLPPSGETKEEPLSLPSRRSLVCSEGQVKGVASGKATDIGSEIVKTLRIINSRGLGKGLRGGSGSGC